MSSTPPEQWPDPVGSERWFRISVYFPADFQTANDATWFTLTQWKGYKGGGPPLALEVKRGNLRFGGDRANRHLIPSDGNIGRIPEGGWTDIVVGMRLSTSASDGWVEVHRDGAVKIARMPLATMDLYRNAPDPIYFKQGIYRSTAWDAVGATHILHFGATRIGTTRAAVEPVG